MAEPRLIESPNLRETPRPKQQIKLESNTYIHHLASLPGSYAASTSSTSDSDAIQLFDKTTLKSLRKLEAHHGGCTSLKTVKTIGDQIERPVLVSGGKDGVIKVWDERSNSSREAVLQFSNSSKNRPILSFDVSPNGMLVAGGTALQGEDALILYWDSRKPTAPIRTHSSTHSDDITALHFQSSTSPSPLLLSASADGLISTSNAEEDDEEEAGMHVGNWGCSVAQVGWVGERIWGSSDMETFSTWSAELDPLQSLDIRAPSVHTRSRTWVTDYLITCYDGKEGGLTMFMGSNEGDIAQVTNDYLGVPDSEALKPWLWTLEKVWSHGHEGVVRSLLWDGEQNILVTGGEDAKLNVWSGPVIPVENKDLDVDMQDTDGTATLGGGSHGRKREHGTDDMDVDEGSRKKRR
ncbi:hypothetical protein AAF712_013834 [Marasmius tenuissimus]|uniref:WD40 repeat-like protein n=1 Tax=Marasmius tenuissimus TaxID=585030 RepID=A0ABR2ZDJ1_9AGAR|nr:hypothetical protein PM082_010933 [Marasmius tenuissimus]